MTIRSGRWGRPRSHRLARLDQRGSPFLFVAPFFVLFGLVGLFPFVFTAYVSLFDWSLLTGDREFTGLANYAEVLRDGQFWNAMGNTLGIFVLATVPQLIAALLLADLLNRALRARTALRMSVLVPNITSVAAVGIVFGLIFSDRYGLANWVLDGVGLDPVAWREHRWSAWLAVAVMVDWRWTGYNALIYLAAMQAIPRDLYESAALDGASRLRQLASITVPMIRPTILFTVVVSTIGQLQLFTEPLMFGHGYARGGVRNEFQTVAMYIYERTFERNFEYGYGSAVSWLLFLFIVVVAGVNVALVRRSLRSAA